MHMYMFVSSCQKVQGQWNCNTKCSGPPGPRDEVAKDLFKVSFFGPRSLWTSFSRMLPPKSFNTFCLPTSLWPEQFRLQKLTNLKRWLHFVSQEVAISQFGLHNLSTFSQFILMRQVFHEKSYFVLLLCVTFFWANEKQKVPLKRKIFGVKVKSKFLPRITTSYLTFYFNCWSTFRPATRRQLSKQLAIALLLSMQIIEVTRDIFEDT